MKKRPNLFDYATKELSQDAFIVWLLNWADKEFQEVNPSLHACAVSFVRALLGKDKSLTVDTVEAGRQWNNIDIWALVDGKYFLVIEDKKGTSEHSNQLKRYAELANKHYGKKDIEVRLVYFKMEEQSNFWNVKKAGYAIFARADMMAILTEYINTTEESRRNNIAVDFYENLSELDRNIKSYLNMPLQKWHWHSWIGFYAELQKQIGGEWNYVPNRSGGFLGFWWNWHEAIVDGKEFKFYLQLEQDRFVFKLTTQNAINRGLLRDVYRKKLFKKAAEMGIGLSKFGRSGQYMGVARLNAEYRIADDNGVLDLPATVKNLKRFMELIDEIAVELKVVTG